MSATRQQLKTTVSSSITFEYNRQNTAELLTAVIFEIIENVFNLAEDEVTIQQVKDLATTLSTKADLVAGKVPASQLPAFSAYWGALAKAADNAQTIEQAIASAVAAVVNASPAALDTLNELAAALGNDANFAATVNTAIAAKIPLAQKGAVNGVATLDATGKVPAEQLPASTGTGDLSSYEKKNRFGCTACKWHLGCRPGTKQGVLRWHLNRGGNSYGSQHNRRHGSGCKLCS